MLFPSRKVSFAAEKTSKNLTNHHHKICTHIEQIFLTHPMQQHKNMFPHEDQESETKAMQ
ncbi:MAG TPA: hypothetical protein DCE42_23990 [Myxococcales bacterium]|nr:hypothetical protein [Deltaproteobacteria bacterium]HAA57849.1 hypothetical protein [Myxococcales bacterium]|tara:strand:+ start:5821 stop:6000 length:180 start_codon:yes stop_codon:yes gene_type:complete